MKKKSNAIPSRRARIERQLRSIEAKLRRKLTDLERLGIVPYAKMQRADMERTDYALMRGKKLPEDHDMLSAAAHILREMDVPNADSARRADNLVVIGPESVSELKRAIAARVEELKPTSNGQAVKAVHFVCAAANRQWYERMNREQRRQLEAWMRRVERWVEAQYGRDNVMSLVWHIDEETPHLHAIVLPLEYGPEKRGAKSKKPDGAGQRRMRWCYNAKAWFGSPRGLEEGDPLELSKRQDEFFEVVREFGLVRGEKGSKRGHTSPKAFEAAKAAVVDLGERIGPAIEAVGSVERREASFEQQIMRHYQREVDLDARERQLDDRDDALREREVGVEQAEARQEQAGKEARAANAKLIADGAATAAQIVAAAEAEAERQRQALAILAAEQSERLRARAEKLRRRFRAKLAAAQAEAQARSDAATAAEAALSARLAEARPLLQIADEVQAGRARQLAMGKAITRALAEIGKAGVSIDGETFEVSRKVVRAVERARQPQSAVGRSADVPSAAGQSAKAAAEIRIPTQRSAKPRPRVAASPSPTPPAPKALSYEEQARAAKLRREERNAAFDLGRRLAGS